ncbi:MAG TPA: hypothetical protein VNA04_12605 [Thermoanaerobaculia bacterium]|nr:hypothetical protein [Thermoanaerobaculia bacterium]
MNDLVWLASLALFALAGLVTWRLAEIRRLDRGARASVALTCGLVFGAVLMYAESVAGIPWSRLTLGLPLLIIGAAAFRRTPAAAPFEPARWPPLPAAAFAAVALVAFHAAATARMTIGDLLLFWGPKARHFFHERAIDVAFLKFPHYYLMHPDYPPLVPLTWAGSSIVVGSFSYWGAVYTTPVVLLAAALAFRGFAAGTLGARKSAAFATLLLTLLVFTAVAANTAGGGDPYLVLFETVALSALTFSDTRAARIVAATALAGAALTKIEGAAFVAAMALSLIAVRRWRTAAAVSIPAAALVGSWVGFANHHGLLDGYARAERQLHLGNVGLVLGTAARRLGYGAFYLPWIAALATLVASRTLRRAALPLLVGVLSIAYSLYFYLNEPDPAWWIRASVERVMITPLMCFVVASAACHPELVNGAGRR